MDCEARIISLFTDMYTGTPVAIAISLGQTFLDVKCISIYCDTVFMQYIVRRKQYCISPQ